MNDDVLLVVLTENCWLYAGLAALLPEMVCLQSGFFARRQSHKVRYAGQVLIVVDSRILFRGEWSAFNALRRSRPDARVVWLTREETGRMFPEESRGDLILKQHQDVVSLRLALKRASQKAGLGRRDERVEGYGLTLTERRLLPIFLSGVSVPELSQLTGKTVKTLYTQRHQILEKMGFRLASFLQFVYELNRGLPGIPGLEHTDDAMPQKSEEEETGECTV